MLLVDPPEGVDGLPGGEEDLPLAPRVADDEVRDVVHTRFIGHEDAVLYRLVLLQVLASVDGPRLGLLLAETRAGDVKRPEEPSIAHSGTAGRSARASMQP